MGTETASYISQLVSAWPVGGVDNYASADDHLRTLKVVLQTQFPNLGAVAITPTGAQLNFITGLTSAVQTQLDARELLANKNAANGYAGLDAGAQLLDARVKASNVTQHQGSLALATSQTTSGTFADARIAASNVTQHQAALAIATSQLTGNMPDARIVASNITQHQASINIAGSQVNSGTLPDARIQVSGVTQHQGSLAIAATQVTSGVFADARVQQSNVTQHQAALAINTDQLITDVAAGSGTTFTPGSGDAESIIVLTNAATVTVTLPNSIPSGWAVGDSMIIIKGGAGTITFTSPGTLRSKNALVNITPTRAAVSVTLLASGDWQLIGDLS